MSIIYKDSAIKKIYYKGCNIKKVYKGSDLVFDTDTSSDEDLVLELTVTSKPHTGASDENVWIGGVYVFNGDISLAIVPRLEYPLGTVITLRVSDFESIDSSYYLLRLYSSYIFSKIRFGKGLSKTSIISLGSFYDRDSPEAGEQVLDLTNADFSKITDLSYWVLSLNGTIIGYENLNTSALATLRYPFYLSLSNLKNTSLDLSKWDVSNVTTGLCVFYGIKVQSIDVSNWDWKSCTSLQYCFYSLPSLTEIKGIEYWNVSNITTIGYIFSDLSEIKSLNLAYWDINPNAKGVYTDDFNIIHNCDNLESVDLSNITYWRRPFISSSCPKLKEVKVTNCSEEVIEQVRDNLEYNLANRRWDLIDGTFYAIFKTSVLTNVSIPDVNIEWYETLGTANVTLTYTDTYEDGTIETREVKTTISFSLSDKNRTATSLTTSCTYTTSSKSYAYNVIQAGMPSGYILLKVKATPSGTALFKYQNNGSSTAVTYTTTQDYVDGDTIIIDNTLPGISLTANVKWNFQSTYITACYLLTEGRKRHFSFTDAFYNNTSLTELDLYLLYNSYYSRSWHIFYHMCYGCTSLEYANVTMDSTSGAFYNLDIYCAFYNCTALSTLKGIEDWNISYCTDIRWALYKCPNLPALDLSKWDTSHATRMKALLYYHYCNVGDLSGWDTSNVTDMSFVFHGGWNRTTYGDISNWNVSKVTTMLSLFYFNDSSYLTSFNLSGWKTPALTDTAQMFGYCSNCTMIDLSNFIMDKVTTSTNMFSGCTKLTEVKVTNCNATTKAKLLALLQTDLSSKNWALLSTGVIKNLTLSSSTITSVKLSAEVKAKCSDTTATIPISITTNDTYTDGTVDTLTTISTVTVTFDANTTSEIVTRTGTATYEGTEFTWTVTQAAYADTVIDWGTDGSREFSPNPDSNNVITLSEIPSSSPTLTYTNAAGSGSFTSVFLSTKSKYGNPSDGISGFKGYFENYYSSYGSSKYTVIGDSTLFDTWINAGYQVMWGFVKDMSVVARYSGTFKCAGPKGVDVKGIVVMSDNAIKPAQYADIAIKEPDTTTSDGRPAISLDANVWYTSCGFLIAVIYN